MTDGEIGGLSAYSGSEVRITGGTVTSFPSFGTPTQPGFGGSLYVGPNVTATISGGSFGDRVTADSNSNLTIEGSEFRINGQPIAGMQNIGDQTLVKFGWSTLTGVLGDGTPFAFTYVDSDYIDVTTLKMVSVPAPTPRHIYSPLEPLPRGVPETEILTVSDGGTIPNNFNAGRGSIVHVLAGGRVGTNFEAVAATVNLTDATVGPYFGAFDHSNVRI